MDFILLKEIQIIKNNFVLHVTYFSHLAQTWVQKKREKRWKNFLSKSRNSANKFLEGLNKWFFSAKKKKGGSIYLVRTNTIEKNNKKKVETTME